MTNDSKKRELDVNGTTVDATIYYKNSKPCAVALDESPKNTGAKLNEVSDKAMLQTANAIGETHKTMKGGDKLYAFANNGDGTYKQQPFEMQVKGSIHDQSAKERTMKPYGATNNSTDHKPLDSVHKDRMNNTISELQGKNTLAENKMSSIDRAKEQKDLSQSQKR